MIQPTTTIKSDDRNAATILQRVIEMATGVRLRIVNKVEEDQINITANHDGTDYYDIDGLGIMYGGDMAIGGVADFCEHYFKAVWLYANDNGLHCEQRKLPIKTNYKKTYIRPAVMRVVRQAGSHSNWLSWHRISPKHDERNFHESWFAGMSLQYPNLAPKTGRVNSHTKINLLHPDAPAAIYQKWAEMGKPPVCSLFEIDGNGYWWQSEHYDYSGLDKGSEDWFRKSLAQGLVPALIDQAKPEARQWWEKNVISHQAHPEGKNRVSHLRLYFDAYKAIEYYFKQKNAKCRFRILAYGAYYYIHPGMKVPDLSNFDVYFCPPECQIWDTKSRLMATENLRRWARSGAKMIFRPNLFSNNHLSVHRHNQLAPFLVQLRKVNGGLFLTSNYIPGMAPVDWYIRFRVMKGLSRQRAANEFHKYMPEAREWTQRAMGGDFSRLSGSWLDLISDLNTNPVESNYMAKLAVLPQLTHSMTPIAQSLTRGVPDEA
jgi:hypothetical protein